MPRHDDRRSVLPAARPDGSGQGTPGWLRRPRLAVLAAVLAAAVCTPALGGPPIWDDVIVFERYLPAFGSVGDAFMPPPGTGELGQHYYRPFVTLSYMSDVTVYGETSFVGHHVTTIAFHVLATVLLALVASRLLGSAFAGGIAALVFAVHPVHVDTVAQITGRCDSMALVGMLGAMFAVIQARQRDGWGWWGVAAGALFFGAGSKEVALVVVVPLALLVWRGPGAALPWSNWLRLLMSVVVGLAPYFALRAAAAKAAVGLLEQSFLAAVARVLRALAYDVHMLLLPWPQSAFVPIDQVPGIGFGILAAALCALTGWLSWRAANLPGLRMAWTWAAVSLAPALALVLFKASEQPVAERYLYVPSVAVALVAGSCAVALAKRCGWRPVAVGATGLVIAFFVQAMSRSTIYADRLAFWRDTVARAPSAGLPVYQLGLELRRRGELEPAMAELQRALELYDDDEGRSLAHNTIGTIHLDRREWGAAERHLREAVELRPDLASAWFNLAGVFAFRAGRPLLTDVRESVNALERAVSARPGYEKARLQHAMQLLQLAALEGRAGNRAAALTARDRARSAAQWLMSNGSREVIRQQARDVFMRLSKLR